MKSLESMLDLSSMREDASKYKGIIQNVAGATSEDIEDINELAAGINTQNYYISGIPGIPSRHFLLPY